MIWRGGEEEERCMTVVSLLAEKAGKGFLCRPEIHSGYNIFNLHIYLYKNINVDLFASGLYFFLWDWDACFLIF